MDISALESYREWTDLSVFIEMKPRNDLANIFIDVPPGFREKSVPQEGEEKKIKYNDIDVVNVTDSRIRVGAPPSAKTILAREKEARSSAQSQPVAIKKGGANRERSVSGGSSSGSASASSKSAPSTPTKESGGKKKKGGNKEKNEFKPNRYGGTLKLATMNPKTLVSPTWAETCPRLFICKLQITPNNLPLVQKTLHRLAVDICKQEQLEAFAARGNPRITCSRCHLNFLSDEYIMTIGCLPDDEWLATTQSADFYCRDNCGAACDPDKHKHGKANTVKIATKPADEWLPHEKRVMISFANSVVHISSVLTENVTVEDKFLICAGCKCQLGRVQKNHSDLYCFNHISTTMTSGPKKVRFVEKNLLSMSLFMSQLILNSCETQGSLKLVVRSLDKVPYMLVWLLDSYVVLTNGTLEGLRSEEDEGAILKPFPAIKLLYKIFNNSTAASDPRANGEDTSVGLVDIPLPCCELLIQMLLRSSLSLPTPCRAVGQFFVGYFQIDEHF